MLYGFGFAIAGLSYGIWTLDYQSDEIQIPTDDKYPYHLALTKSDLADPSRKFYIESTLTSSTFSAQSYIGVSMTVKQESGSKPDYLYIIFPRANFYDSDDVGAFSKDNAAVLLPYNRTYHEAYGTNLEDLSWGSALRYELEGCYNIVVTSDLEVAKASGNIYDPSACSEIRVASLEVTSAAETNKINTQIAKSTLQQTEISLRITWILLLLTIYGTMFSIHESMRHKNDAEKSGSSS